MKNFIIRCFIFIMLIVLGLGLALTGQQDSNLGSILMYQEDGSFFPEPIIPGKSQKGIFTATENNLAIVRLRIQTYNRINNSHIIFRLREVGQKDWSVTNTYALDRFSDGLLYPFGFAPIDDSSGKVFEFELLSVDGSMDNAIGIYSGYHNMALQYVQPMSHFAIKKFRSVVSDPYSLLYLSIFFQPAFIFVLKFLLAKQMFLRVAFILAGYIGMVYVYVPVAFHSNIALFIAAATLYTYLLSGIQVPTIFRVGIAGLIQIPLLVGFGNMLAANRMATLVFFSLLTGVIMAIRESKK
jgi:hypothetical protein